MLRLRLASLALASGVLFTLSGCCAFCENGQPSFPRLFNRSASSAPHSAECECHNAFMAPPPTMIGMSSAQGPILMQPSTASAQTPIPITNLPATQPPQMFRVPNAPPTAYVPN